MVEYCCMHISKLATCLLIFCLPLTAHAVVTAYDDASDPVYTPGGLYHSLNGGFGFAAWQHSLPAFPAGSGGPLHAYVASSTGNDPLGPPLTSIDTAGARSWGNNADPTGNTFQARRNLVTGIGVGGTYSISYDGGDVDGKETIAFGMGNFVMCEFFFEPASSPNYQFKDILSGNPAINTGIPQTWGGLRLTLTRDSASTYQFDVKRLSDNSVFGITVGQAYDTTNITAIRTLTVTNTDGGAGLGHSMYVNAIEATAIPEPASLLSLTAVSLILFSRRARPALQRAF